MMKKKHTPWMKRIRVKTMVVALGCAYIQQSGLCMQAATVGAETTTQLDEASAGLLKKYHETSVDDWVGFFKQDIPDGYPIKNHMTELQELVQALKKQVSIYMQLADKKHRYHEHHQWVGTICVRNTQKARDKLTQLRNNDPIGMVPFELTTTESIMPRDELKQAGIVVPPEHVARAAAPPPTYSEADRQTNLRLLKCLGAIKQGVLELQKHLLEQFPHLKPALGLEENQASREQVAVVNKGLKHVAGRRRAPQVFSISHSRDAIAQRKHAQQANKKQFDKLTTALSQELNYYNERLKQDPKLLSSNSRDNLKMKLFVNRTFALLTELVPKKDEKGMVKLEKSKIDKILKDSEGMFAKERAQDSKERADRNQKLFEKLTIRDSKS